LLCLSILYVLLQKIQKTEQQNRLGTERVAPQLEKKKTITVIYKAEYGRCWEGSNLDGCHNKLKKDASTAGDAKKEKKKKAITVARFE